MMPPEVEFDLKAEFIFPKMALFLISLNCISRQHHQIWTNDIMMASFMCHLDPN